MLDLSPLPSAWLGYARALPGSDRPCIRICMSCPDRTKAEKIAVDAKHDMTHTFCPQCYQNYLSKLLGESND